MKYRSAKGRAILDSDVVVSCFALILLTSICFIPGIATANVLKLDSEVYIEKGLVPHPYALAYTHDNNLIIAGDTGAKQSWVVKSDLEGNIRWRYTASSEKPTLFATGPQYESAAVMQDDSIYACGSYPDTDSSNVYALLTHLDGNGKVIDDKHVLPPGDTGRSDSRFRVCLPYDNGLIIIGTTDQYSGNPRAREAGQPPMISHMSYWILFLDQSGKETWQHLEPINVKNSGVDELTASIDQNDDVIIAAARNGIGTELLLFDKYGNKIASTYIDTAFRIVEDVSSTSDTWLVSTSASPLTVVKLDHNLRTITKITGTGIPGFVTAVYKMDDGEIVTFGSKLVRSSYRAQVAVFDADLNNIGALDLSNGQGSFQIFAALPYKDANHFVSVRNAVSVGAYPVSATSDTQNSQYRLGVAIDTIALK